MLPDLLKWQKAGGAPCCHTLNLIASLSQSTEIPRSSCQRICTCHARVGAIEICTRYPNTGDFHLSHTARTNSRESFSSKPRGTTDRRDTLPLLLCCIVVYSSPFMGDAVVWRLGLVARTCSLHGNPPALSAIARKRTSQNARGWVGVGGRTCHAPLVSPLRQSPPLERDQYTPLPLSMDTRMLAGLEYTCTGGGVSGRREGGRGGRQSFAECGWGAGWEVGTARDYGGVDEMG